VRRPMLKLSKKGHLNQNMATIFGLSQEILLFGRISLYGIVDK
jgi:hypothetical protein